MPRILVYVDIYVVEKHIAIHCESKGSCCRIFQQFISGNFFMETTIRDISSEVDKSAIRIAVAKTSFWIRLWVNNCENIRQHQVIKDIATRYLIADEKIKNSLLTEEGAQS